MARIILISGASTGIGAQTALELAAGNKIFVHYNSSEKEAKEVCAQVDSLGGQAIAIKANLRTEEGCRGLAAEVMGNTESLDVLINNAGGLVKRHKVADIDWDLMTNIISLNTFSAMMVTKLFLPLLKKGTDPSIINITSVAMRHGAPTATIYGASKGALDSFTRGCAKELAPNIRVNAVAPGVIETPFHEKYTSAEQMEVFKDMNPLKTHGTSAQIAKTIRFIIENGFMTGETVDVNGGVSMR